MMFTPELFSPEHGAFVLVANHSLENAAAVALSIEYNKARIAFGLSHVPNAASRCRLVYEVRGQRLADSVLDVVRTALGGLCKLEFMQ
jgi:hypothetical protein